MNTVIDCLALVMTLWMLYCFARYGIYPAIRLVLRMIGAVVRFVASYLQREHCDATAEHVAEVCASSLIVAPGSQRQDHD